MQALLDLVYAPHDVWTAKARVAFSEVLQARYPYVKDLTEKKNEERRFQLRVNPSIGDGVAYAALIGPEQELSGGYGGMSFVMFPSDNDGDPCLIGMVVGTRGVAPDELVLGRPGHARKCAAIAATANEALPGSAWCKRDPTRTDLPMPAATSRGLDETWGQARKRYGKELYLTFAPPHERSQDGVVREILTAMIDLFFAERGVDPKKEFEVEATQIRRGWLRHLFPHAAAAEVVATLRARQFAVLEGPPGTGKSRVALELLGGPYGGRGGVVQFHPGTTYESFIGGLAPQQAAGGLGLTFVPTAGHLMRAAAAAAVDPGHDHLLVIDEINRADLAKVLGEAILLLEPVARGEEDAKPPRAGNGRAVQLAYDFDGLEGRSFSLPPNLHVLGTMNSADRSIAILDVAVRRRFAFLQLWPQLSVVEAHAGKLLRDSFYELLQIFLEHASDDGLALLPGHAYFLGDDREAPRRLRTGVRPLLEEYLAQGYVSGFAEEIRAYLDRHVRGG